MNEVLKAMQSAIKRHSVIIDKFMNQESEKTEKFAIIEEGMASLEARISSLEKKTASLEPRISSLEKKVVLS
jgi:chromosome segregation ATPase